MFKLGYVCFSQQRPSVNAVVIVNIKSLLAVIYVPKLCYSLLLFQNHL